VRNSSERRPEDAGPIHILAVAELAPEILCATPIHGGVILRADELTLRIRATETGWQVHKQWRDQDRGTVFRAETSDDVVRYLMCLLANDIRAAHRLPALRRPLAIDVDGVAVPAEGFSLEGAPDAGFILSRRTHGSRRFFASDVEAAKFSYLADEDVESLQTSLLHGAPTTREGVLEAIRREGLHGYRWFEDATNQADVVAIARTPDEWAVFATDERATPVGRREFASEEAALEHFLSRLRAANRVTDWRSREQGRERGAAASLSVRYFIREHLVDGRLVPVRLFRRRMDATGPTDEYLADVDAWLRDSRGVLDRAVRFPLDADLEEISADAAGDVIEMVAARTYVPLRRR